MMSGLLFWLMNAMAQAPVADFSASPTSGCSPLTVHFTDQSTNKPLFWSWDFGNGNISSLQNPVVSYNTPGTYNVKLIVRNTSGSSVVEKDGYITVYPGPTPQFSSNLTLACAPAQIQFTDQSNPGQGNITSWDWSFGDGSTSNDQNPAHTYAQTGYYTVMLKVTNSGGCYNYTSRTRDIRVVNGIQPNFTFNQQTASCSAPFTGQLLNQSAGPGNLSFNWTVNNGATLSNSADTSPVVTFPNSSQYNVNLQVTSSLGCTASMQQTLPFANNLAVINGPTSVCVNTPATFSDGSNPTPPSIMWTFGDGSTFNTDNVSKTFPTIGAMTVKLLNKYAACADSITETVNVIGPPTPNFTATPTTACKPPLTVQFTDASTSNPPGNVTGWSWDFGDGSPPSTLQNPSHTYVTGGNFNVTLTAMGPGGCANSATKNAFVTIQPPTATIGGILKGCISSTATFNTVSPTVALTAVDGPQSYLWAAPGSNEGSSTSATPSFSYPNQGAYTISVTVTTTGGCQVTASTTVNIGIPLPGQPPSFTFTPASPVCNNQQITFTASPAGESEYVWDFGDHTPQDILTTSTDTHHYNFFGPHTIALTVYNGACPQQSSQVVQINPPFALFAYGAVRPVDCNNESAIQFTDTSFIGKPYSTYGTPTWSWDFGDGQTSTIENPQHTYTAATSTPALYTVTLTVTQGGCTSAVQHTVTIAKIIPSFTMPATACRNAGVVLTSTSTPITFDSIYSWQFDGAGTYSTPYSSPTLDTLFATNGNHTVSLVVYDINNCPTPPVTKTITITGPHAAFTTAAGACKNATVTFTDHSTPDPAAIVGYKWDFDDKTIPTTFTSPGPFTHTYTDTGRYDPLYIVTDAAGCRDQAEQYIQITSPTANFAPPDSFYCPGVPLTFIDSSQGYKLTEQWTFGDGNSVVSPAPPVNTYVNNGVYPVSLTVTDQNNCTDTKTRPVQIQSPIAAFNIYDTTGICTPLETIFAAHGQYYDSLYWQFGDAATSTLDSTSHFYNNYGIDTARLFVKGPGGCLDSASRRILVTNPGPATRISFSPVTQCDSVPANFQLVVPGYTAFTLNFGDNAADSSEDLTPFHMYRNPGGYRPQLAITDETGCIVLINAAKQVVVLGATPFFTINKHSFCDSNIVALTDYTISNDGFASEIYNFGDGSPSQGLTPGTGNFDIAHDFNQPGIHTVSLQISTKDACTETYSDTVHVYQTPHPAITVPAILCSGLIPFQGSLNPPQTDSILWSWNFGDGETSTNQNATVALPAGNYRVRLNAAVPFGCTDSASSTIAVNPAPEIKGPNVVTIPLGIPVTIPFTYSPDVVSYNWTPTSNLSCSDCANPIATLLLSATYTVSVTDANGCIGSDTILIKTVCNDKNYWFPNTFSPNGDGVNDYFYPRGTSLYNIQSLTIFNRWGQQVFARMNFPANQQNMGWDGTFGGKPAPADAYVYIAQVICENAQVITISGNITLIR